MDHASRAATAQTPVRKTLLESVANMIAKRLVHDVMDGAPESAAKIEMHSVGHEHGRDQKEDDDDADADDDVAKKAASKQPHVVTFHKSSLISLCLI